MNPPTTRSRLLRLRFVFRGLTAVLFALVMTIEAIAQGVISGRVSNATTGANLEGAVVSIPGTTA
jgi:hypothetical protein